MALPDDFNPTEHLMDVVFRVQNHLVLEEFNDIGDDTWDADITTSRGSLRVACTHRDEDSIDMMLVRLWLFYGCLRKAQDFQLPVYGIPVDTYQIQRKFKPQITLYFQEHWRRVDPDYAPVAGEISFRLMNEDSSTLTEPEIHNYAQKVKTAFASGTGFVWKKGKDQVTYTDPKRGYGLRVLCSSRAEGDRVIEQVLDIQSHTPDAKKTNYSENKEPVAAYPTIPPHQTIIGRSRRLPRSRPRADVHFQYALLHVWGLPNPICLVDQTGKFRHPIVRN